MTKQITSYVFDDIYSDACEMIEAIGARGVNSRVGVTDEMLHVGLTLQNPRQRWCTCRRPVISPAYSFAELIYTLSGSSDASIINKWNPRLPEFQGRTMEYPGAYGERLRKHFGFDQLERAFEALQFNPDSRQIVLEIWSPKIDLPISEGRPNNLDIPCNICSMLKVRNKSLYWTQIMRSNDIFLGLPYDVLLFSSLQEIIAGWLRCEVGEYYHFSDSLHRYDSEFNLGERIDFLNNDDLRLEKSESDQVIRELFAKMCELGETCQADVLVSYYLQEMTLPEAYNNIFMILCAYVSFRRGKDNNLIKACLEKCTNQLYNRLFEEWMQPQVKM